MTPDGPNGPRKSPGDASRTGHHNTLAELYGLPPAVPIAAADRVLGVGATLSKRLRANGEYPVRLLPGRGRHHAVSLADLLTYLGLPLPAPGNSSVPDGTMHGRSGIDGDEGVAA